MHTITGHFNLNFQLLLLSFTFSSHGVKSPLISVLHSLAVLPAQHLKMVINLHALQNAREFKKFPSHAEFWLCQSFLYELLEETFSRWSECTKISLNSVYSRLGNTSCVMLILFWLFEYNFKKRGQFMNRNYHHSSTENTDFHYWGYNLKIVSVTTVCCLEVQLTLFFPRIKNLTPLSWSVYIHIYVLYSCYDVLAKWQELRIQLYVPKRPSVCDFSSQLLYLRLVSMLE